MDDRHLMAVTDDEPAELTVGAVRELVERLEKLEHWQAGAVRPVTGKGAIDRALADEAARRGDTEHLVRLLRANGVTRYKRGDVEIELSQGPLVSAPGLEQWLPDRDRVQPNDDWRKAWPEEPRTPEERAEREAREGISAPGTPEPEPPVEQPPVEIDMAAVDELIKKHDAKRRGATE